MTFENSEIFKNALEQFILSSPPKHVITNTNDLQFKVYSKIHFNSHADTHHDFKNDELV